MRVSTINSTMTCPRCQAPVKGDYKYCPECACRIRRSGPGRDDIEVGGRGTLLVGLVAVALLGAGVLVGMNVLGDPPPPEPPSPPPVTTSIRVADLNDQLAPIEEGVAYYAPEHVAVAPPPERAFRKIVERLPREERRRLLRALGEEPRTLTRWRRALTLFYDATADLLEEKTRAQPVYTHKFHCMLYEVARGQYKEFLRAVELDPSILARQDWVRWIWRGEFEGDFQSERDRDYAERRARYWAWRYREDWWAGVLDQYKMRDNARRRALAQEQAKLRMAEEREEAEGLELADLETLIYDAIPAEEPPQRPAFLRPQDANTVTSADLARITDVQAVSLLVPPAWVRVQADGSLSWGDPESEDLPVTGVCWWDATMFTVWAQRRTGNNKLRLPNWREWQRVFHGGQPSREPDDFGAKRLPGRKWPWGNEDDRHGCNNLNHAWNADVPRLRDVREPYSYHRGQTVDGVMSMAGNAAEWTRSVSLDYLVRGGKYYVIEDADREAATDEAFVGGGSYLLGIDDCTVESLEALPKTIRRIDVGFRLVSDTL